MHFFGLDIMSYRHQLYIDENFGNPDMGIVAWEATWSDAFLFFPTALKNGLFEPLFWNAEKPMQLFISIELIAIWLLGILSIFYNPKFWKNWNTQVIAISALGFILMLGMMVVNYGSMARYRSLPILILLSLICISFSKKENHSATV